MHDKHIHKEDKKYDTVECFWPFVHNIVKVYMFIAFCIGAKNAHSKNALP